ncbi:unnamed protein product [Dovyalis caffra]|uniref:Uncharacterized protein n=1 Tax=Dovyalis caffra TaxID=77055 RepID=A0AAV1RN78_9ROSI|nr:unnamed protein product [Dovyalis caffra]
MGDGKKVEKWPLIKPKKNLRSTRLKDTDLFTNSWHNALGGNDVVANMVCDCSNGFNNGDITNAISGSSST